LRLVHSRLKIQHSAWLLFDLRVDVLTAAGAGGADSSSDYVFEYVDSYVFAAEWAFSTPISLLRVERSLRFFTPKLEFTQERQGINLQTWL